MKKLMLLLVMLTVVGCGSLHEGYVRADELTYDAVAMEYQVYMSNDPALSDDQKVLRLDTITSWRHRIDEAKRELNIEGPDAPEGE